MDAEEILTLLTRTVPGFREAAPDDPWSSRLHDYLSHSQLSILQLVLDGLAPHLDVSLVAERALTLASVGYWLEPLSAGGTPNGLQQVNPAPRLDLRPLEPSDFVDIYRACNAGPERHPALPFLQRNAQSPQRLQEHIATNALMARTVVSPRHDYLPVGVIVARSADLVAGTSIVEAQRTLAVGAVSWPSSGLMTAALPSFVRQMALIYPIRRVHFRMSPRLMPLAGGLAGRLFREEGCLRAHEYQDGEYVDQHILTLDVADSNAIGG